MSFDDREKISQFVDPAVIAAEFGWADDIEAMPGDKEVAITAVIKDRAQFVVNAVTTELTGRLGEAQTELHSLFDKAAEKSYEILAIGRALGIELDTDSVSGAEKTRLEELESWLGYNGAYNHFVAAVSEKGPFKLAFPLVGKQDSPSLSRWKTQNNQFILDRYGRRSGVFERAANVLSRVDWKEWAEKGSNRTGIGSSYEAERAGKPHLILEIEEPDTFLWEILSLNNFGTGAAAATVCIAEIQRQQGYFEGNDAEVSPAADVEPLVGDGLDNCSSWEDFYERIENRESIVLWFEKFAFRSKSEFSLDVLGWLSGNQEEIRNRYGFAHYSVMSGALGKIRYPLNQILGQFKTQTFTDERQQEWIGVKIDPHTFFSKHKIKGLGPKTAAALVRAADVQKDQFPAFEMEQA